MKGKVLTPQEIDRALRRFEKTHPIKRDKLSRLVDNFEKQLDKLDAGVPLTISVNGAIATKGREQPSQPSNYIMMVLNNRRETK